jgi:hypothetical protein
MIDNNKQSSLQSQPQTQTEQQQKQQLGHSDTQKSLSSPNTHQLINNDSKSQNVIIIFF